jgi:hypothetical protein
MNGKSLVGEGPRSANAILTMTKYKRSQGVPMLRGCEMAENDGLIGRGIPTAFLAGRLDRLGGGR